MIVIEDKVKAVLEEKFKENDFKDCFIVDILQNNSKIQVFIDSDDSLNLNRCAKISRHLEAVIEENNWLGPKYTLEVSSPGATRPLVPRQYPKHIGRKVKIKSEEGKFQGELEKVEEKELTIHYTEVEKQGKKKIKHDIHKVFAFEDIKEIKVIISF